MNTGLLLAALPLIGDDPDRVNQIRKIVVALAITGKLDSRAVSLRPAQIIESVVRVKTELAKQGAIPKQKQYAPVTQVDLPDTFSDPSQFARLGELARIEKGKTGIQQARSGSFPLVVTAAERASCDHFDFDGAAAIIPLVSSTGHGNASLNRLHYQEGRFALGTILAAVFPHEPKLISARFLFEYLSAFKDELLVTRMTGTANVTLTIGGIAEVPIPLVCPRVQKRVDELMALCDQLESARVEREATRDRLTVSSLARLNTPDSETFQDDARFMLNALPALTTRPDQIKQLRQAILDLAVRGKLVLQDPKDEPASELLKRIAKEKARLVQAGEARKAEIDPANSEGMPFFVPSNWVWTRLGSIGDWGSGSTPPRGNSELYGGSVPWFKSGELNDNRVLAGSEETVTQLAIDKGSFRLNKPGDVLLAMYGATIGKVAILAESAVTNQAVCGCTPFAGVDNQFLFLFLLSQREQFHSASEGGAQPNISKVKIVWTPFPLPPLAEQYRIVAKVDALMALCDQLETSLTDTATARSRLLDSLLAEALEPA